MVWASPPCKKFSVAAIGHSWMKFNGNYYPESEEVIQSVKLVKHTIELIQELDPEYWFVENPRGMLRNILGKPEESEYGGGTVTYCQYGDDRMKPTDLWGNHPDSLEYKSCSNGDDCHVSASRGSKTGTQGKDSDVERAMVPKGLSEAILEAVSQDRLDSLREMYPDMTPESP